MAEKLIPTWKERLAHLDRPTDFAEAQAAKMEVAELRRYIRELESASQPGGREVKQKPVAWMHTMDNTEGIKGNKPWTVITTSKRNPFGKPGIDYSASYPVTSEPLYRTATSAGNGGAEGCDADQA